MRDRSGVQQPPYHTSWTKVIVDYIADPNMGPFARTMRKKVSKSD